MEAHWRDGTVAAVEERTYGVGELAGALARMLHQVFPGDVWVRGQIRNLSRSSAGHVYFELAEPGPLGVSPAALIPVTLLSADRAVVNAVMAGAGRMADGVEVRICGRLGWFSPRGRLQLRMTTIDPAYTLGRLGEDRDRLLAALRAEGLLTRNRGLSLDPLPLHIGLVTSDRSAAHADFLHELERSGFGFRVLVADARTQGLDAGPSVARAIALVVAHGVDVVAVVRGGGSRTDLAPFDGAAIARAVALAPVPVLTGIGHEVDRSIADEVAHTSSKTPTACATALVERVASAVERSEATWAATSALAAVRLDAAGERVRSLGGRITRATEVGLSRSARVLDGARRQLAREAHRAVVDAGGRLDLLQARAVALDPAVAMARGWSITRKADGSVVRSTEGLDEGVDLVTTVTDGAIRSRVTAVGTR